MFLCPVVLSVAIISCTLVFCNVPNACPLPSALHSLPSVWSCGVVPSLCPGPCVCVCVCVFLCVASMFCSLLPFASSLAICCPVLPSDDLRRACVCVCLFIRTNMAKCAPMCSIVFFLIRIRGIKFNVRALLNIAFARRSWVGAPSFGCDHNICFFFTFFLSSTDPHSDRQNVW